MSTDPGDKHHKISDGGGRQETQNFMLDVLKFMQQLWAEVLDLTSLVQKWEDGQGPRRTCRIPVFIPQAFSSRSYDVSGTGCEGHSVLRHEKHGLVLRAYI